ncbi:acetate--CoA ligase alpha subunit [Methanohalophilus mahii]|uniref:acetate--CoA ligase (ADP-forming) n=1 Tax=Methanohalophilus mahii (strain ATCC 35705 / DSM 5219 / SLP) TaxID=547558 RepID=D5E7L2_METMS|nr:acetate--CoA ligase [Methanohalophilus mahii]ADE37150.1 acetyl coenzyme A synthetase (ADP forming), alpha domain protein [Methanohalophilus mahii DSM 5219]
MLSSLFNPKSVAVIGASNKKGKVGNAVLSNLIKDFGGNIYPVNPRNEEIEGLECYASINDVSDDVDLAVVVIPAKIVPSTLEECGRAGVKYVVVISAGFKEAGVEGAKLERSALEICRKHDMRMVGPNCLGIMDPVAGLNASFAASMAYEGNIAMMSQSGAICTSTLDWAEANGMGFSKFVSLGNKADLGENQFLAEFRDDPSTSVIAAYLEGIKNGSQFIEIARDVSRKKPVVLVKSGRTAAGSRAVSSHTGTLAGSDQAYNAAFDKAGVVRADTLEDMLDYIRAFSTQPIPAGRRIAILTNAGGLGILTADACYYEGLELASFSAETIEGLREFLPDAASFYNPVDVLGDASAKLYGDALEIVLKDPNVDGVILLTSPQAMTDVTSIARIVIQKVEYSDKPVLCSFVGGTRVMEGNFILVAGGVPNYIFPERAVASMGALCDYGKRRNMIFPLPEPVHSDRKMASALLGKAAAKDKKTLGLESFDLLKAYGIPVVEIGKASSVEEAIEESERIGYPVVMKVLSPDISHKTDVGGIRLSLMNKEDVRRAYHTMMSDVRRYMPSARIAGVQLQRMIEGGREVIIGMNRDVQFGPLLMFGLGGTYVEILKDVSFRLAPLNEKDAHSMISSIRSYPLLTGVRGEKAYDVDAVADVLIRVSRLVEDFPQILEFEINPLMVLPEGDGCFAMDMRLTLKESN